MSLFFKKQTKQIERQEQTTIPSDIEKIPDHTELMFSADTASENLAQSFEGILIRCPDEEDLIEIHRKVGCISLPVLPEGTVVKAFGSGLQKAYALTGTVAASARTRLVLKDVEVQPIRNRREHFRVSLGIPALLTTDDSEYPATVLDISASGARVTTRQDFHLDDRVLFTVDLSAYEKKQNINTLSEIVWAKPAKQPGVYVYGLLFAKSSEQQETERIRLLNLIQTKTRKL